MTNDDRKNSEEEMDELDGKSKKKKGRLDRWIMGMLIGSAVGSVIGLALAPKSGKETRNIIKKKGQEVYKKSRELGNKIQKPIQEYRQKNSGIKEIPQESVDSGTHETPRM